MERPSDPSHIEAHLRNRGIRAQGAVDNDLVNLVPWLIQPMTITDIARELGVTRRMVEYWWEIIQNQLAIRSEHTGAGGGIPRMRLIRQYFGIDPCRRCHP
jgi:hypothetical protein